ncbi:hypothetical protein [Mycobacterium sp. GA-1285]|uniref:hypothetical protein n=1 Tax=Mycobacterium sp. GA-1285 TaxID=1772282 RepID=UPI0020A3EF8F|nr:hypothetical protein [Mycobacterium sp. GA-1285]
MAVTISVTADSGDEGAPPSGETFGLASADDTGPANIITEDPSCAAWTPINDTFVDIQRGGWNRRDAAIPAAEWTPDQRREYQEVGRAAGDAAEQTVAVTKVTPHRVMRELYEQFIAYARAYSDAVPTYKPADEHLAGALTNTASTITWACYAITYGSAEARAPLVAAPPQPSQIAHVTNPATAERFLESTDPICSPWYRLVDRVDADTKRWQEIDPSLSASEWSPEQRAIAEKTIPVMMRFADDIQELGIESKNPVIQDLATLVAQYRSAYAAALPTYTKADSYLSSTSARAAAIVYQACKAVES